MKKLHIAAKILNFENVTEHTVKWHIARKLGMSNFVLGKGQACSVDRLCSVNRQSTASRPCSLDAPTIRVRRLIYDEPPSA